MILEFVTAVTDKNSKDYVEPAERVAVFDNDGTLWVEYPMYTQVIFAFDRVKALLSGDMKTVGASGMKDLMETAAGFEKEASNWLATTKQQKFNRLYTELVYQPPQVDD